MTDVFVASKVTRENGATEVVPGSHSKYYLYHINISVYVGAPVLGASF